MPSIETPRTTTGRALRASNGVAIGLALATTLVASPDVSAHRTEDYLQAATQGMEVEEDHDQIVPEELGGPFIETSAAEEFALDTDEANPEDASREPLPRTGAGLVLSAPEGEDND